MEDQVRGWHLFRKLAQLVDYGLEHNWSKWLG